MIEMRNKRIDNKRIKHFIEWINNHQNLSKTLITQIIMMFIAIQIPFDKAYPNHVQSFLSYNYVIRKIIELQDRDDLLHHFPLLSKEKVASQDIIWEKITKILGWKFIPSHKFSKF